MNSERAQTIEAGGAAARQADFTISSGEGLPIRATISTPVRPRGMVVMVHGFKGFKEWGFFPWLAESLGQAGFVVCRFNMSRSGIGESGDVFDRLDLFERDTYSQQLADLRDVVAHVHDSHPFLPIFLFGHSRGGGIALLGARDVPHLRGVVTWSSIARAGRWDAVTRRKWRAAGHFDVVNERTHQVMRLSTDILDDYARHRRRLDIGHAARSLHCPLLVVHGTCDESVPVAESQEIAAHACDVSQVLIGGAGHTFNAIHPLIHVTPALAAANVATRAFLTAYSETRTVVTD